ncbi:MAG TPA: chromosome partition protein MukE [Polyangiaceae bacterium]|nr:chromosome partition protein MukE [Polyangiaceae bacterium]
MSTAFSQIGDVVSDESFPAVDLALRRGRHIHKGDESWYAFLFDAQPLLEQFYGRYGYELIHRSDGYFFLLPANEALGKRQLSVPEMIVGQGLALAYLEPSRLEKGGIISREELLNQLASAMGADALLRTLAPQKKRPDERVAQRNARNKIAEALRRLEQLGFVELLDGEQLRLAPSLLRFAEPVRGLEAPSEALRQLIERGEVSLGSEEGEAAAEAELESGVGLGLGAEPEPESGLGLGLGLGLGAEPERAEARGPEEEGLIEAAAETEVEAEAQLGVGLGVELESEAVLEDEEGPLYAGLDDLDFFEEPPPPEAEEA